jgi:toxin HigB-1
VIRSFRHKGLERFFRKSDRRGIAAEHAERLRRLLDRLDAIRAPEDMNLPGLHFHELKGNRRGTYAVRVSGNWRLTFRFRFDEQDCTDVDLEDYH